MNRSDIVTFTRRITSANRSELIVVLYDIYEAYLEEAKVCLQNEEPKSYRDEVRRAGQVLEHLKNALDQKYELSLNLYSIYDYAERELAKAIYTEDESHITEALRVIRPLREAFKEVAKADHTDPMMQNTEHIAAGMTYGRHDVNEVTMNYDGSRGFFA